MDQILLNSQFMYTFFWKKGNIFVEASAEVAQWKTETLLVPGWSLLFANVVCVLITKSYGKIARYWSV